MNTKKSERQQERTISALLSSNTLEAAARKAGISKRTLLRWMDLPEFRDAYRKAKGEVLRTATAILTRDSGKAALTLTKIFSGKPTENQSARVSAAKATLRLALDAFALEHFEERLLRLEAQGRVDEKFRLN
jgi:hypothetical protein